VFHGPAEGDNATMPDLTLREGLIMVPFLVAIVFLGVYPKPVIERMEPAVDALIQHVELHVEDFDEPVANILAPADDHAEDDAHGEEEE
jgi:NADH-quinone oxidoreductase subunit M